MARVTREGTLQRNFQGFTDDPSPVLIGMGSSAISGFPGLLAQNDKHNGRYRALSAEGRLSASHGIARSPEDRLRGGVIEALLCRHEARLSPCLMGEVQDRLEPFTNRNLAELSGTTLRILPGGLPYARVIASLFDSYRAVTQRRFSSAI
jgi:oxygen-independent coproporphyrinogen-3 oxidase